MNKLRSWRIWLLAGFIFVIVFIWLVEIFDLPHVLLGAPSTELNWQESLLENFFTLIMGIISWVLIASYENKWSKANAELKKLASIDSLTGVLSRRSFLEKAEAEFTRAKRFTRPFTCGIIDIDVFKSINDNFGHLIGDKVLEELARVAMNNIRQQDFIGRLGGDEFGIAFVETSETEAHLIIERIGEQWKKTNIFSDDGRKLTISFSTGISSTLASNESLIDCIRRTDHALYAAKQTGKNRAELA
jgi:diguanylate cyclase (GGDEF)-like protein